MVERCVFGYEGVEIFAYASASEAVSQERAIAVALYTSIVREPLESRGGTEAAACQR
jgi:hypothetical protein